MAEREPGLTLVDYARRLGYELRAGDGGWGIGVLDHPSWRDRIAVGRDGNGQWAFASVPEYALRSADESPERAFERLRECIARSPSRGSTEVFRDHVARLERSRAERAHPSDPAPDRSDPSVAPPKDALNRRMHDAVASPAAPRTLTATEVTERQREFVHHNRAIDERLRPFGGAAPPDLPPTTDLVAHACAQLGYVRRPNDGGLGIAVLDNEQLRDRVAVARAADGRSIYADVREYVPRAEHEPAEEALRRLRACIGRSHGKGGVSEFLARAGALQLERGGGVARPRAGPVPGAGPSADALLGGLGRPASARAPGKTVRHHDALTLGVVDPRRDRGPDRGR